MWKRVGSVAALQRQSLHRETLLMNRIAKTSDTVTHLERKASILPEYNVKHNYRVHNFTVWALWVEDNELHGASTWPKLSRRKCEQWRPERCFATLGDRFQPWPHRPTQSATQHFYERMKMKCFPDVLPTLTRRTRSITVATTSCKTLRSWCVLWHVQPQHHAERSFNQLYAELRTTSSRQWTRTALTMHAMIAVIHGDHASWQNQSGETDDRIHFKNGKFNNWHTLSST